MFTYRRHKYYLTDKRTIQEVLHSESFNDITEDVKSFALEHEIDIDEVSLRPEIYYIPYDHSPYERICIEAEVKYTDEEMQERKKEKELEIDKLIEKKKEDIKRLQEDVGE